MTQRHLVACPGCTRHVRVTEEACPFCGATLPASLRESAPPQGPSVRLSRAALLALGALGTGTMAMAPGCGGDVAGDGTVYAPPYGIPPVPDAGDDASDATINFVPPYGIAPVPDADDELEARDASEARDAGGGDAGTASDAGGGDAGTASDAGAGDAGDAGVRVLPPYGIAP